MKFSVIILALQIQAFRKPLSVYSIAFSDTLQQSQLFFAFSASQLVAFALLLFCSLAFRHT